MKFEHYILTHFNTRFKWSKKGRRSSSQKAPDKSWMKHRISLFDKYCYPSIIAQTNKNFKWLIFLDDETTDKKLFHKYVECKKIFLKDYKIWSYKIASNEIKKILDKKTEWVLTTRFDCDDSLSKHYIDTIQKRFIENDMILNPTLGITYNVHKNIARRFEYLCPNSFLTAVEKVTKDELKTCFRVNHPQLRNHFKKFVQVKTKYPLWLQTIHGKNLGNVMRGKVVSNPSKFIKDFNIRE